MPLLLKFFLLLYLTYDDCCSMKQAIFVVQAPVSIHSANEVVWFMTPYTEVVGYQHFGRL
jgi:hypothetical protein